MNLIDHIDRVLEECQGGKKCDACDTKDVDESSDDVVASESFNLGGHSIEVTVYSDGRVVIQDESGYVRFDDVKSAIKAEKRNPKVVKWLSSLDDLSEMNKSVFGFEEPYEFTDDGEENEWDEWSDAEDDD